MRSYVIHFIRHGLTEANKKGMYIGNTDLPLIYEGAEEIKKIKATEGYPAVEMVFSSPLKRCVETARIIYPSMDILTVEEMREYDFGDFDGKTGEELDGRPDYIAWTSGKMAPPGGEATVDFVKRLALGLNHMVRAMMEENKHTAACVMHGGAIMMLFSACAVPRRKSVEWTCSAGEGFSVRITPSLYHSSGIIEVFDTVPSTQENYDIDYENNDEYEEDYND